MSIYEFTGYRQFLKAWLLNQPRKGHGLAAKMAANAGVSSTMISQILSGDRFLNLETASQIADFVGLMPEEQDYFFLLVDYERAGTQNLKLKLKRKINSEQARYSQLKERLKVDAEVAELERTVFYSSWLYTGIRNLSALTEFNDANSIAERLRAPKALVQKILDFLVAHQFVRVEAGHLVPGPHKTHLSADSPHVIKHHQNWRLQGFQQMQTPLDQNLFFTAPMSLSHELATEFRYELPTFIENFYKRLGPSKSETVRCLNIDWFEY